MYYWNRCCSILRYYVKILFNIPDISLVLLDSFIGIFVCVFGFRNAHSVASFQRSLPHFLSLLKDVDIV